MSEDLVDEPDDLCQLRIGGHELTSAIFQYLRYAIEFASLPEDEDFEQFKGQPLDGPVKTGADYAKGGSEDPLLRLEFIVRALVLFVDEVIARHQEFVKTFDILEGEFARLYPGLQHVSGFEARSHCKALESFAFHVVRYTFDSLDRHTPDEELDSEYSEGMQRPFSASSWHPTCEHIAAAFSEADVEDRIHEAIEQECDDAWSFRLAENSRAGTKKHRTRRPPLNVNGRMFDELSHDPAAADWTLKQWAGHLQCAPSAIQKTNAWKLVMEQRAAAGERRKSRTTKPYEQ